MTPEEISERRIPGNASKWQVLERMAHQPFQHPGLTSRDLADIYGWEGGPPDLGERTDSRWQRMMSHIAADLRYLRSCRYIYQSGKLVEGWGKGNPVQWKITPQGRGKLNDLAGRREHRLEFGTVLEQRQRITDAKADRRARRDTLVAELKTRYDDGTTRPVPPAVRQAAMPLLREQGLSMRDIAAIFRVTAECVRLDINAVKRRQETEAA